jgi:hypothetical protein
MNTLTPEQTKSLKLFSYYCQSNGAEEVDQHLYMYQCTVDHWSEWWSKGFGASIEPYAEISKTIEDIVMSNNLLDDVNMDCENNGNLRINIDCKERKIKISAEEYVMRDNSMGDSLEYKEMDEEEKLIVDKIFNMISLGNHKEGRIFFDGGGDSGEIYERIEYGNGKSQNINDNGIMEFLYRWLENFYGGWEINEGSHGEFIFGANTKEIILDFNEHTEDTEDIGTLFYAEF